MISKAHILDEIRRTADANSGKALGKERFERETGIREWDWSGRYWARWSEALAEAGYAANEMNTRLDDEIVLEALASEVRNLGRFPTASELRLRRRADPSFPSQKVFERFGGKQGQIARLLAYCQSTERLADIAGVLQPLLSDEGTLDAERVSDTPIGYVYLLKSGRFYKIGRTNAEGRRHRELSIQLPERARQVHVIKTDDPVGIERYWHQRFAEKRVRSDAEWFDLAPADIAAFRRRTFQ